MTLRLPWCGVHTVMAYVVMAYVVMAYIVAMSVDAESIRGMFIRACVGGCLHSFRRSRRIYGGPSSVRSCLCCGAQAGACWLVLRQMGGWAGGRAGRAALPTGHTSQRNHKSQNSDGGVYFAAITSGNTWPVHSRPM